MGGSAGVPSVNQSVTAGPSPGPTTLADPALQCSLCDIREGQMFATAEEARRATLYVGDDSWVCCLGCLCELVSVSTDDDATPRLRVVE